MDENLKFTFTQFEPAPRDAAASVPGLAASAAKSGAIVGTVAFYPIYRAFGGTAVLLLLGDGLVLFVPRDELLADLLGVGELATLEPGVRDNVRDGESLMRVEVEHRRDQILELRAKCFSSDRRRVILMQGPEIVLNIEKETSKLFFISFVMYGKGTLSFIMRQID